MPASLEQAEQVAAHVGDLLALGIGPGVAAAPVAGKAAPKAGGGGAEAGMGLRIAVVLVAANGDQRVALELASQERDDRRDRERVAVDEDDHLVVRGRMGDQVAEQGELQLVLVDRDVGCVEELVRVVAELLVEPGVDAVRLIDVALQVAALDVDPAVGAPVHRGYVDHRTGRAGNGSGRAGWRSWRVEAPGGPPVRALD